jgi:hypothetical protein
MNIQSSVPVYYVLEKGTHPFHRQHRNPVMEIIENNKEHHHDGRTDEKKGKGHMP